MTQEINQKMSQSAIVKIDIKNKLPLIASGKVRDLYAIDDETLLFVASDRISAYDVIMENVSPKFTVQKLQFSKI
jgi:phosphoribosylaminoimidazole-succinocarboxamide synthase